MNLGIENKIALVTASSAGIGLACAQALASEGARVCIASRSEDRLLEAKQRIIDAAPASEIHYFTCNMDDPVSVKTLCNSVKNTVGNPEILVNNTGGPKPGGFFDLNVEEWDRAYRLMVASTVVLYQELIPSMQKNGWGRIVNITSTSSRQPISGLTLSNSFRPGLLGLAKTVANDVGKDGVLINTVMPGITLTDRMAEIAASAGEDSIIERLRKESPLNRAADPAEQGNVVAFLCSNAASYVTGSALAVDGGAVKGL